MGTQIFDSQIKDNILLTGTPTAPTPSVSDDSTRIATTEFVHNVFGEFYPTGVTPTYVDSTHFTVSGDLTAIFTQGRVLKITDTGGTFNAICATSAYDSGTELTTVTVAGDTIDSGISAVLYAVQQVTGQIWESGSNANGEYIKFADGTMICNKVFISTNVDISTTWGALYVSSNIGLGNWAAVFTATPVVSYNCNSGTYFLVFPLAIHTVTSAGAVSIARPDADTARERSFNIIGIGRWY